MSSKTITMLIRSVLLLLWIQESNAWTTLLPSSGTAPTCLAVISKISKSTTLLLAASGDDDEDDKTVTSDTIEFKSEAEKKEAVGNLVADDEWAGLSMELSEVVRVAVLEDLKKNTREFLGKDDYNVGDITKEIDARVKEGIADFRGKEDYELGDFIMALDELSKQYTEKLTGKPYEAGDLSKEIDTRVKSTVAEYCGKEAYEFGDLTREVASRVQNRVEAFTGKPYEFGDIAREVEERRKGWVKNFLGEEAAENYVFGDITKKALAKFAGKEGEDYQFGDLSKKIFSNVFGKRKTGGS